MYYRTSGAVLFVIVACACMTNRDAAPSAELGSDIKTPHVAWGNPLDGGPIRTLFIAPRYTLRDAVELAQRLEIELDAAPLWDRSHLEAPDEAPSNDSVTARITEALQKPHDVIVLGNFDLNVLPVDVQSEIIRQVSRGTGLLLANHDPADGIVYETFMEALAAADALAITRGLACEMTPEWSSSQDLAHASTYGEGRVVQLSYREDKPLTHCLIPALANPLHAVPEFLDSYFSLVARAVVWAAKRDRDIWVESVEILAPAGPPEEEIPPGLPPEFIQTMRDSVQQTPIRTFRVHFNRAADRDYGVSAQLREPNRGMRILYHELADFEKGQSAYTVEVLAGPGRYLLDIWFEARHGTAFWHTETISIEGWPSFSALELSKDCLLPHDSLDVSADIRTWYGEARPVTLYVRGVDSLGRVVTETYRECPEGGGAVIARLNFADLIARDVRVEAYAVTGPPHPVDDWELNMSACEARVLPVRHMRIRSEPVLIVDAPAAYEYNARSYLGLLRKLGVDAAWTDSGAPAYRQLARLDLRSFSSTGWPPGDGESGFVDWTAPDNMRTEGQRLQAAAAELAVNGVLDYSMDTYFPPSIEWADTLPEVALPAFRKWLEGKYGTPEALRRIWGVSVSAWEEVTGATLSGSVAMGGDVRRFRAGALAPFLNSMRGRIRDIDRYARVGMRIPPLEPSQEDAARRVLASGLDWIALASEGESLPRLAAYARGKSSIFAELRSESFPDLERARWLPWYALASGCSGLWLPCPYTPASAGAPGLLHPDGRMQEAFQAFIDSWRPLQDGIAQLVHLATPERPKVAIYDPILNCLPDEPDSSGGAGNARDAIVAALRRLGYTIDYVADDGLSAERLLEYEVLVLPGAQTLTERAVAAIRQFLSHGGDVLADTLPGLCEKQGPSSLSPALAADLGVRLVTGDARPGPAPLQIALASGTNEVNVTLNNAVPDTILALDGGTSLASSAAMPVWIAHRGASGGSLLLNHRFPEPDGEVDFAAFCQLLDAWLRGAGLRPALDFECVSGGLFDGELHEWSLGDTEFFLLLRNPGHGPDSQTLRFHFEKGSRLYDLSHGSPATVETRPRIQLRRGQPLLLARLSYEVNAMELTTPKTVVQGERLPVSLTLRTKGGPCGVHVVHSSLKTVRGVKLAHYDRVTVCEKGSGQFFLPTALNDLPGHYILEATDRISGVRASAYVQIHQRIK